MATLMETETADRADNDPWLGDYTVWKPFNDWSVAGYRGARGCVETPTVPLSANRAALILSSAWMVHDLQLRLQPTEFVNGCDPDDSSCDPFAGGTFIHIGVVWGLRVLSPLWQDTWNIEDDRGRKRPGIRCVNGLPEGCVEGLKKTLVLMTDGGLYWGRASRSRLGRDGRVDKEYLKDDQGDRVHLKKEAGVVADCEPVKVVEGEYVVDPDCKAVVADWTYADNDYAHPASDQNALCDRKWYEEDGDYDVLRYLSAVQNDTPDAFHDAFSDLVQEARPEAGAAVFRSPTGHFSDVGRGWLVDHFAEFGANHGGNLGSAPDTPERRTAMDDALRTLDPTAWELFVDLDPEVVDTLVAPENQFALAGRPTEYLNFCRAHSSHTVYGKLDDYVYAGEDEHGNPIAPVAGVAPFETRTNLDREWSPSADREFNGNPFWYSTWMRRNRLDTWLLEACRLVGLRGVELKIILYRDESLSEEPKALFEQCAVAAGGDQSDVFHATTIQGGKDWLTSQLSSSAGRIRFVN